MRLWCHSEELHSRLTIIHNLENRLAALNEQYKAEVQNTQKVHIMHPRCKNVQNCNTKRDLDTCPLFGLSR